MANYLSGNQDFIPQLQAFQPDLNFYKSVMDVKQSQYKAGYDKVSNMYGQLLNSELSRPIDNERRTKFFTKIASEIQRMSGVDLSLQQNVDQASQVFQPLIDDENILIDMAKTKRMNSEYAKSESFRNCVDEKKCGGKWWPDGQRYIEYKKAEFSKTTDEQAKNFETPVYTPYINVAKEATKLAKEMGFNMQSTSWTKDGKYIITTKNGPAMTMSLTDYFSSVYGNDPQVKAIYEVQAYLQRKDFSYANAEKYGSEEAAENFYLTDTMNKIETRVKEQKRLADIELEKMGLKKNIIDEKIADGDVDPEDIDDAMMKTYNQLLEDVKGITSVIDQKDNTLSLLDKSVLVGADTEALRWRVDQAMASDLLTSDLYNAADNYAMLNMEEKFEADPYAKASYENSLSMGRMAMQHQYNMDMVDYRVAMGLVGDTYSKKKVGAGSKRDYIKGRYSGTAEEQLDPFANPNATNYKPVKSLPGATAEVGLYEADIEKMNSVIGSRDGASVDYLTTAFTHLTDIMHNNPGSNQAKLAKSTLIDIIGQKNVDFAVKAGYMTEDFSIVDPYLFSTFIQANREQLMTSTSNGIKSVEQYLFDKNTMGTYYDLDNSYELYKQFKPLAKEYENRTKEFVSTVKNTFLSKLASDRGLQYDEQGKEIKSQSWISRAGRWIEDYGLFIPGGVLPMALVKGAGFIKDQITGEKSHMIDFVNKEYQNRIASPSSKNEEMFMNNMFEKDGVTIKTEDAFVASSMTAYKQNRSLFQRGMDNTAFLHDSPVDLLRATVPMPLYSLFEGIFRSEDRNVKEYLQNVYKTMKKTYLTEYSSGRLGAYNQGTHTYADGMDIMVDGADFSGEAFNDYISIMDNYSAVQSEPGVKVLRGAGVIDTEYANTKNNQSAIDFLTELQSDMINVTYSFNDGKRPMIRMINQKVAANDANMTAYTFQVNSAYIMNNIGNDKKPGKYSYLVDDNKIKKNADMFTIYIPKDLAQNDYMDRANKGPYQTLLDQNGSVSVHFEKAFDLSISNVGNVPTLTTTRILYDRNTGKEKTLILQRPWSLAANVDDFMSSEAMFIDQFNARKQYSSDEYEYNYNKKKK